MGVIAELKHGRLHGVRDPVFTATVLAEKLLELEQDPERKDQLAQQMDRLLNRAPSLLKIEPDFQNYFTTPPDVGPGAMTSEAAGKTSAKRVDPPDNAQSEAGDESGAAGRVATIVGDSSYNPKTEPVEPTEGSSDGEPSEASENDEEFKIVVRPSRLSF